MDTVTEQEVRTPFTIQTSGHEGPLELILELIEKRKLQVNELSLSQVTDDFITYVRTHEAFPMEDASNFIGVAATLLLIKSRSLIPEIELSTDEEQDVDDLKRRLEQYEKAREASRALAQLFGRNVMVSAGEKAPEVMFAPSRDLNLETLQQALTTALTALEKEERLPEVRVKPTISLEDMMDDLKRRVERAMTMSFKEFTGEKTERVEMIVSFLALLELVKQGHVETEQFGAFGDIRITNTSSNVPRY
ncbi:MAG: segregation and condensation protein A [Parcubacteria bacterium C7867-007]|nr:MAG: segregation and condensation protein A [Parcubacteria bacterium C7867-007]